MRGIRVPDGTVGFTRGCADRDRRRWPYATLLSDQHGHLIFQSTHATVWDAQIHVSSYAKRIREGKPNLGGQIPTSIDVDGIPRSTWEGWME